MTDTTNDAKALFADIVKKDIDALFDQPLSEEEVNVTIMEEIGTALEDATLVNNVVTNNMQDMAEATQNIEHAEIELANLEKMAQLKASIKGE
jgi:hypothetical protein